MSDAMEDRKTRFLDDYRRVAEMLIEATNIAAAEAALYYAVLMSDFVGFRVDCAKFSYYECESSEKPSELAEAMWVGWTKALGRSKMRLGVFALMCDRTKDDELIAVHVMMPKLNCKLPNVELDLDLDSIFKTESDYKRFLKGWKRDKPTNYFWQ